MEIYIEESNKKNGFITLFDDDGMVTVQMSDVNVAKIISIFDNFIFNKQEHDEIIEVTEFGNTFKIHFTLKNNEDGFNLTGSIVNSNFYHDFELEYCDINTWNILKELCNS